MNNRSIKFSIIIPTFNREEFILKSIESVINQTYENWELLIIDNQSTDNTIPFVKSIQDSRVYVFQNEKNYERCYSRNRGIELSKGDFVLFLDSDDFFSENHLMNWSQFLIAQETTQNFFFCNKQILENNSFTYPKIENIDMVSNWYEFIFSHPILPGQVCVPKILFSNIRFNSDYLIFEDTAVWLQLLTKAPLVYCNFNSFVYVVHESNSVQISTNFGERRYKSLLKFLNQNKDIVNQIRKKNIQKELSGTLFTISKYYMMKQLRYSAIKYILLSLIKHPVNFQLKHKILVLFKLLFNLSIKEYHYK